MKKLIIFILAAVSLPALAQINTPQPSPLGTITQKVGLTDISINYSRPGVKDRKIFGELVPFGEMWRVGANASTKIKFSDNVSIQGQDVPAGEYALYMIPRADKWTVVIHKNITYWGVGDKYTEEEDLMRFDVVPTKYPVKIETLTFNIADVKNDECTIEMLWENTGISFAVNTQVDAKVMAEIAEKMKGVSASTYYQAARYYLENDKDIDQALEWINKALVDNEKFWIVRQKALILEKMERYPEAIAAAELSKKLAEEAKNSHYVMLNEKSIAEWQKMKK